MDRYLIKLGGGLITDKSKPRHVRQHILTQVAAELGKLYHALPKATWLIGNGAGSFGHYTAHVVRYKDDPADPDRIAAVRQSVAELNGLVVAALQAAGVPAQTIAPHTFMYQQDRIIRLDYKKVEAIYQRGAVPVPYGDVIDTNAGSSRVVSTEEVLKILGQHQAALFGKPATACIYATSVDGVLDHRGNTIPFLQRSSGLHVHQNSTDYDLTGGMAQKVAAGFEAFDYAQRVYIVNGNHKGHISRAVELQDVDTQLRA